MRKVIEGKAYDTETAGLIVVLPCPHAKTDWKWSETRLYRSPRGAYFLAGEGGSCSSWAKITPGGAIPSKGIEPISKDETGAYAIYAGLSPDRFAGMGSERVEGNWLTDGQIIQGEHVIDRTI